MNIFSISIIIIVVVVFVLLLLFPFSSHQILAAYITMMVKVAMLMGADEDEANKQMRDVLAFGQQIANVSFSSKM